MTERQEVKCPHPQCDAILKIPAHWPAGEYDCICKTCKVRLSWSTGVNMERRPFVELVTKDEVQPINVGDRVIASFWGSEQAGIVVGIGRQGGNDTYSILADGRRVALERGQVKKVSPCQGYKDCALRHAPERCAACNPELMAKEAQP